MNSGRITVLVENTAGGQGLLAEHGLSFWIEIGSRRILFDTGQTGQPDRPDAEGALGEFESDAALVLPTELGKRSLSKVTQR